MREHERDLGTADLAASGASYGDERDPEPMIVADDAASGRDLTDRGDGIAETPRPQGDEPAAPLFADDEAHTFRARWEEIQTAFVDEPRGAVQRADNLVAETMKHLAEGFADERAGLEEQWASGSDVSTEDLRLALRRYRNFFDRLLSF